MKLRPFAVALLAAALPAGGQGTGVWEGRPRLLQPRQEVGAAVLDGRLYVGGGLGTGGQPLASVERYDPATRLWTRIQDLPTTLHHFGMAAAGGLIYAVGGYVSGFSGVAEVWAYDPGQDRWSARAPLPRRRGALAAVEIGGRIYAVGGVVPGVGVVGDLTVYDPAMNQWAALPSMAVAREHLAAAAVDGKLHVAGGRRSGQLFGTLEMYDPGTNRWTTLRSMPTPRGGNGAAALLGRLLVFGGEGGPLGNFPEVEEYDPGADTWRRLTDMSTPLHGIYPVTVGDEVMIGGGGLVPGYGATDLVLSFFYERPAADCAVLPASVPPGGGFTCSAGLANPGRTRPVDLYLGYAWAGGLRALYRPDLALAHFPAIVPTFGPLLLPEALNQPLVPLFAHPVSPFPPGTYSGFLLVTAAGAFLDGRVDPGDILSVRLSEFVVR